MQKLLSCLMSSLLLSCGHSASNGSHKRPTPRELREDSLRFVHQTLLLDEGAGSVPSSGGFAPNVYESSGFWPATPLVLPAHAATFLNESYGATQGFAYQSFDFATTGCSADQAFTRYFVAIETVRGGPLNEGEKSQIEGTFSDIFTESDAPELQPSLCLFYDLIACVADYAVHNAAVLRHAAATGNYEAIFTGAASCVAEVIGATTSTLPYAFDSDMQ